MTLYTKPLGYYCTIFSFYPLLGESKQYLSIPQQQNHKLIMWIFTVVDNCNSWYLCDLVYDHWCWISQILYHVYVFTGLSCVWFERGWPDFCLCSWSLTQEQEPPQTTLHQERERSWCAVGPPPVAAYISVWSILKQFHAHPVFPHVFLISAGSHPWLWLWAPQVKNVWRPAELSIYPSPSSPQSTVWAHVDLMWPGVDCWTETEGGFLHTPATRKMPAFSWPSLTSLCHWAPWTGEGQNPG